LVLPTAVELQGDVNAFPFCLNRVPGFLTIISTVCYGFRIYGFSTFLSSMRADICIEMVYCFGGLCGGGVTNL
jgi:hypothetical protein